MSSFGFVRGWVEGVGDGYRNGFHILEICSWEWCCDLTPDYLSTCFYSRILGDPGAEVGMGENLTGEIGTGEVNFQFRRWNLPCLTIFSWVSEDLFAQRFPEDYRRQRRTGAKKNCSKYGGETIKNRREITIYTEDVGKKDARPQNWQRDDIFQLLEISWWCFPLLMVCKQANGIQKIKRIRLKLS